jgi:hypothetical protein
LGGSAAAAAAAAVLQGARLNLDAGGGAVHGVGLLVTLFIVAILVRLTLLHLDGPSLEDSSWDRHAHRASVREAPFVALCGLTVAAMLTVTTPWLVVDERLPEAPPLALHLPEPETLPAPIELPPPVEIDRTPAPPVAEPPKAAPRVAVKPPAKTGEHEPIFTPNVRSGPKAENISIKGAMAQDPQDNEPPRRPFQDPMGPLQDPEKDRVLQPEPATIEILPPVHGVVGVFLAAVTGEQKVDGATGKFQIDLEDMRGTRTFEAAAEITAEFALDSSNALRITYAGMQIFEKNELRKETSFGSVTGAKGDPYEFEMTWSHLYAGLQHRVAGYTPDSWFDFSLHAGAMIDHTITRFDSDPAGVSSVPVEGERGWTAPAVGFGMVIGGSGQTGLVLELLQSVPANLGGQAIALTDFRGGVQVEVSKALSLYFGYRHVQAVYRTFSEPLLRSGGRTSAHIEVRGPVLGIDLRF